MTYGVIYLITNQINGKQYVGLTTRNIITRFNEHCCSTENRTETIIQMAIQKYGRENFSVEELDTANSTEELSEKEIYWIRKLNTISPMGYNITEGGEVGNGLKGERHPMYGRTGKENPRYGQKHSQETIEKMKQVTRSDEFRKNIGDHHRGKVVSQDTRDKISKSLTGVKRWSLEERKAIGDRQRGLKSPVRREVINVDTSEIFISITEASEQYGVDVSWLAKVCKSNLKKKAKGYHWMYLEDYKEMKLTS